MKNKSTLIFTMLITLLVIASIVGLVLFKQSKDNETDSVDTGKLNQENKRTTYKMHPDKKDNVVDTESIDVKGQPILGKKDAKVTLIEFGDFKCPACKYYEFEIGPKIIKKYVDTGKVKIYFVHTPFHAEESILGGLAAETVFKNEPSKYWDFHNALFNLQPPNGSSTKWLDMAAVKKAAQNAKVSDVNKLISDIKAGKQNDAVKKDINLYQKHNVTMTPTIIVDGKPLSDPMDIKAIEKAIDKALK